MRIACIVLLVPFMGCMKQDAESINAPTVEQMVEASDGAKELLAERKSESLDVDIDAIDRIVVQESLDAIEQLQANVHGIGNEWRFLAFPTISGPGGSLIIRKPITDETASQLIAAWKRPSFRILTDARSEDRLADFIRESIAECLATKDTTIRKMRIEQWDFEIHVEPGEADIPGGPTFANLDFTCGIKTDIQKRLDKAKSK